MGFLQNTCKPQGLGGKIVVNMMNTGHKAMAEWGFGHIEVQKGASALDIGCGGGANVRKLLQMSADGNVTGLDYSEISVEKSQKLNAGAISDGRCKILQGNVMELPFAASSFQVVTAFETIYFWPDLVKAFEQVYRVLQKDGVFLICNECSSDNPKDEKWTSVIEGMKLYSLVQIEELLKQAGFSTIRKDKNDKGWICLAAQKA